MKIVFITPAPWLRRQPAYRLGGKLYGQPNSITGPSPAARSYASNPQTGELGAQRPQRRLRR